MSINSISSGFIRDNFFYYYLQTQERMSLNNLKQQRRSGRQSIFEMTRETTIARHHNTEPLAFRELTERNHWITNKSIIPAGKNILGGAWRLNNITGISFVFGLSCLYDQKVFHKPYVLLYSIVSAVIQRQIWRNASGDPHHRWVCFLLCDNFPTRQPN